MNVPYRTLHRFAAERCGFGRRQPTLCVADGEPGVERQIDFARMGLINDPQTGRRRGVHALIFTAVYSRHMFAWLSFGQTLAAVIEGCEAAWAFFGGVFKVLIPDNLTPLGRNPYSANTHRTSRPRLPRTAARASWPSLDEVDALCGLSPECGILAAAPETEMRHAGRRIPYDRSCPGQGHTFSCTARSAALRGRPGSEYT